MSDTTFITIRIPKRLRAQVEEIRATSASVTLSDLVRASLEHLVSLDRGAVTDLVIKATIEATKERMSEKTAVRAKRRD